MALSPYIRLSGIAYDVVIAEYLINPSRSDYSADALSVQYFGTSPIEHGEKQISLFDDDDNPDDNLISEALLIAPLMEKTSEKLKSKEQEKLLAFLCRL